jgi:hypothetical protein
MGTLMIDGNGVKSAHQQMQLQMACAVNLTTGNASP